MTIARRIVVGEEGASGTFHCVVRCVRRAFLCGNDAYSGRNYDHRKKWIRERLSLLSGVFGIDVLTYAVMSNHMHLVLRSSPEQVASWSDDAIARRWLSVCTPRHVNEDGEPVHEVRQHDVELLLKDSARLSEVRKRLSSLSWFMKMLNEHISRRANKEDNCKGSFWESRFRCQRLVDEAAILACMSYVDLNPVRASIAEGIEDSEFTGAHDRIMVLKAAERIHKGDSLNEEARIRSEESFKKALERRNELVDLNGMDTPFSRLDERGYLKLLDWTGRRVRSGKPGYIRSEVRTLLEGFDLDADEWVISVKRYSTLFGSFAGHVGRLKKAANQAGFRWLKGCRKAEAMFRPPDKARQTV